MRNTSIRKLVASILRRCEKQFHDFFKYRINIIPPAGVSRLTSETTADHTLGGGRKQVGDIFCCGSMIVKIR